MGMPELLDVAQALKRRRIDDAHRNPVESDRVPQRIANDDFIHTPAALFAVQVAGMVER
jgi:hypothetical protein